MQICLLNHAGTMLSHRLMLPTLTLSLPTYPKHPIISKEISLLFLEKWLLFCWCTHIFIRNYSLNSQITKNQETPVLGKYSISLETVFILTNKTLNTVNFTLACFLSWRGVHDLQMEGVCRLVFRKLLYPLLIAESCRHTHFYDELWQKTNSFLTIFANFSKTHPCLRKICQKRDPCLENFGPKNPPIWVAHTRTLNMLCYYPPPDLQVSYTEGT